MDYKVFPLTLNQTNWQVFIELYQDLFGISPTRILDSESLNLEKPHALHRSLQHCIGEHSSKVITLSFIGTANADMLVELMNHTSIDITSKESTEERGVFLYVASANLYVWQDAIRCLASKERSKNIRTLGENLLTLIKMAGYRTI